MKKLTKEQKEKIKASLELLCEDSTTLGKIQKVITFLKGTSPSVDKQLKVIEEAAKKIQQIQGGDVIELSLGNLPEKTKKDKDRKKYLLTLLANWGTLKSEVDRLSQLQTIVSATGVASKETATGTAKILATAKGPLGAITLAAAGIVAVSTYINSKAVEISIKNDGCRPFEPVSERVINLPGLKLFSAPINAGDSGLVKLPGVDVNVDTTAPGQVKLTTMGVTKEFGIPYGIKEILVDGQPVMGKNVTLELSKSKKHEVVLRCSR